MFRNPRENPSSALRDAIPPSVGRPPTPPNSNSPYFRPAIMQTKASPPSQTSIAARPTPVRLSTSKKGKQNQSILNFFGKTERSEAVGQDQASEESSLFFVDKLDQSGQQACLAKTLNANLPPKTTIESKSPPLRFNEDVTPSKRQRLDETEPDVPIRTPSPETTPITDAIRVEPKNEAPKYAPKRRGGFVDDSDDSDEDVSSWNFTTEIIDKDSAEVLYPEEDRPVQISSTSETAPLKLPDLCDEASYEHEDPGGTEGHDTTVPTLAREGTSMYNADDFGDDEVFDDEFFEGGEEYMERRWMQEQREMEMGLDEDSKSESGTVSVRTPLSNFENDVPHDQSVDTVETCPMCSESLKGLTETQASSHVNACLDGTAPPVSARINESSTPAPEKPAPPSASTGAASGPRRFQRAAVARPAQANPFTVAKDNKAGQSAFTRLMSGHAEDAAWAEAAANEKDSRGRPAYQRTCPFYKIMPGLYICVDAFRYGKVEGQNAYFLSHFHSDHYIGLTSSWAHGPIYASKVTCNLMRQVLKVDPKWIVPLEFEKKIEVPNTKGVFVTMIPANHCPGSSLYLFEKVIGKNKDGSPKMTRVLHCGDFRACPAHISHPLLRPDVVDAITGQTKQQVIDTCYLDTTYLTPKYSFPGQHDVIDACAQMCISLSKEITDTGDAWEQVKVERMGSTMSKFLEKGETDLITTKEDEQTPKQRGRLLVIIGTYSIGKERICLGIARALNSKIFAPSAKMRICKCLEDPDLNALLTSNPLEAQVHMQTLMEIRAETLHDYLVGFKPHFTRVVGFRPTGWSYRPPTSRFTENPAVATVLHSEGWKSRFTMRDLVPQRGSTKEANCFGVPYSEHSSFRELTMFVCALRINRVVPTVNVGSKKGREKMKGWIEKWDVEKKRNGLFKVEAGGEGWGSGDEGLRYGV